MLRIASFVLLMILVAGAAPRARADGSETPEYKECISLGLAEFDERNFFEARSQFARAHGIYPNARTSRALGMVYFELDMEPETSLAVDGKPSSLRSDHVLMLGVGEHALEFRASGRVTEKRTLNVQGGEHDTLRVRLLPATAIAREQGAPDTGERSPAARPVYKNPWLWTALGVVVAGGAAAAAIMLTRPERVKDPYPGTGGIPPLMGLSR